MAGRTGLPIPKPARGPLRWLARLPILLYRAGLGWLLGDRFLLLTHRGRRTGHWRETVLEVVGRHGETLYVASGWGSRSDWYRNVRQSPEVTIQVGWRRLGAVAEPLPPEAAEPIWREYARRTPRLVRRLARKLGVPLGPAAGDAATLARRLPLVALRVAGPAP